MAARRDDHVHTSAIEQRGPAGARAEIAKYSSHTSLGKSSARASTNIWSSGTESSSQLNHHPAKTCAPGAAPRTAAVIPGGASASTC